MPAADVENVLLVVVDTLRARNLGCYGGSYEVSPTIDDLAACGTFVENAVCTQSGSWVSYTTIFRGDHVFGFSLTDSNTYHEATNVESRYKTAYRNTPRERCVPPLLHDTGVVTSGIVSGSMLNRTWGWNRGFQRYDDDIYDGLRTAAVRTRPTRLGYRVLSRLDRVRFPPFGTRRAEMTATLACEELAHLANQEPWFFFLQFTDPHSPLSPYRGAPDDWNLYDQEIRRADDALARVLQALEKHGLRETTLVVITADHGESLGERNVTGHGKNIFEESIRVPLVFSHPTLPAKRVDDGVVRLKDLGPTILDVFGIKAPEEHSGQTLLPAVTGAEPLPESAFVFATGQHTLAHLAGRDVPLEEAGAVVGLRTANGKFIRATATDEEWFFNLDQDPRERHPLPAENAPEWYRETLEERLRDWDRRREGAGGERWKVDTELEAQLRDLGYM